MTQTDSASGLLDKERYFSQLKRTPVVSWPAVFLLLLGLSVMASASVIAVLGYIPLWTGTLVNGFGLYLLFSIVHESLHRNVSTNSHLNEILGRISLFLLIPAAPLEIARWAHFQHHRFTSSDQDPDNFIHHAKWWQIPLRWPNFDLYYLYRFLRDGGEHKIRHTWALVWFTAVFIMVITTFTYLGYGLEVLFLWILATRIALALIALVFVCLPHYPADITAQQNEYQATTIRQGREWLLTPLFVYQNYHLIHHLYPMAPFYNYIKIWHLKYDELISNKPAIQTSFGMMPVNHDRTAPGKT